MTSFDENLPATRSAPNPVNPVNDETTKLIGIFLKTLTSPQTKTTYNTELKMFSRYSVEKLGGIGIGDLTAEDLAGYREFVISTYSRATAAKKLAALRRFLTFTYMGGFTKINPEAIKFFAKSPKVGQDAAYNILSSEELSRMLACARSESERDYVMIAVMASCGLREAEVVSIKVGDFREAEDGSGAAYVKVRGKGEKFRNVSASPELWSLVQRFVTSQGKSFSVQGDLKSPLFESREGNRKHLTTRSIRYIIRKYVNRAGITKEISPHSIRHTVGTNMATNEAPLLVIQQFLGHSDPKTTMRYIRRAEQLANKAYEYNTLGI